jgi:hypothetical protein
MPKRYVPDITIRIRSEDNWFVTECPDCGAGISHRNVNGVKKETKRHGSNEKHGWADVKFRIS